MHDTEAMGLHYVQAVGEHCILAEGRSKERLDGIQEIMSGRVAIKQD